MGAGEVCTTRLATVVVYVDDLGLGSDALRDLVGVAGGWQADGYRKLPGRSVRVKLGILSSL
jgi:hypothetical protein